jgi:hypothetical protein
MNEPGAQRLTPPWIRLSALVLAALLVGLVAMELGLRLARGDDWLWNWPNLVMRERQLKLVRGNDGLAMHDPRLGFIGRPDLRFPLLMVSHDSNGWRLTPPPEGTLAEPPVLVLGDSFAYGFELSDGETWPARLQALTRRRVVNAAMIGYGLDQSVLRAEIDAAKAKPAAIVMSFIADDLRRMEMKRVWGAEKPYFELVGGALVERNVPVPEPPDPTATLNLSHLLLGRLLLVETAMKNGGWWYEWTADHERVLPRGEGLRLVCPLFRRLARLGIPALVVAEYTPSNWQHERSTAPTRETTAAVLRCAQDAGFTTLDLFETIDTAVHDQGLHAIFRQAHPGPLGAELTARRIAAELGQRRLLPQ